MGIKIKLAKYSECTGCGACKASCNNNAITFSYDRNGFLRPLINETKCVECGICMRNCPILHQDELPFHNPEDLRCFTAWTKNDQLCIKCSSGGVATQLALDFIKEPQSIYYGAAIMPQNTCRHVAVTTPEELKPTIGTKYIQSDVSWALSDAKKKIGEGWNVLFSGTPCQIAAIYRVIPTKWLDKLYTMELICHGAPSQKIVQATVDYYGCKTLLNYRTKKEGWFVNGEKRTGVLKLERRDETIMYSSPNNFFGKTYAIYNNPSCFHCNYAKPSRLADIVLGDQWGWQENIPIEQ